MEKDIIQAIRKIQDALVYLSPHMDNLTIENVSVLLGEAKRLLFVQKSRL